MLNLHSSIIGASYIGAYLSNRPTLELLHLENCSIRTQGAISIANALFHPPNLKSFTLKSSSGVRDEGICAIAGAIPLCPSLEELVLEKLGTVGPASAIAISKSLREYPNKLKRLSIAHNGIGSQGWSALLSLFHKDGK